MPEEIVITTTDRKASIESLIRRLPAMLAGRVADEHGIAAGFRSRIGWAIFSLVLPNFNELGRGQPGADGSTWKPLSPAYLAYQRPITGRKPPHAGGLAPGGKDGFLTPELLKLWNRTYADRFAFYVMREPDDEAKAHAAAIAWIVVKQAGGKTKLKELGEGRKAGVDHQMLVDTGLLRRSISHGEVVENGPTAEYRPADGEQVFESQPSQLVVGSRVKYAAACHSRRRLWPERFPGDWWRQILGVAQSGLVRIADVIGGAR